MSTDLCAGLIKGRTGATLRLVGRLGLRSGATSWDFVCRTVLLVFCLFKRCFSGQQHAVIRCPLELWCVHFTSVLLAQRRGFREIPLGANTSCRWSARSPQCPVLTAAVDIPSLCCQLPTVFLHLLCFGCPFLGAQS